MFGNCNHCCFCCGQPCTMLGVSLFISCKNKIHCVCVEKKQQYIYPHISSLLHLASTLPIPPLWVVTKHRAHLPVLCACFPLSIYFTFGSVYTAMPLFHSVPAYPSPTLCPQVHSLRLHLYSCPALKFFRTFIFIFLDSIYMC